jgi:hypothetical protein
MGKPWKAMLSYFSTKKAVLRKYHTRSSRAALLARLCQDREEKKMRTRTADVKVGDKFATDPTIITLCSDYDFSEGSKDFPTLGSVKCLLGLYSLVPPRMGAYTFPALSVRKFADEVVRISPRLAYEGLEQLAAANLISYSPRKNSVAAVRLLDPAKTGIPIDDMLLDTLEARNAKYATLTAQEWWLKLTGLDIVLTEDNKVYELYGRTQNRVRHQEHKEKARCPLCHHGTRKQDRLFVVTVKKCPDGHLATWYCGACGAPNHANHTQGTLRELFDLKYMDLIREERREAALPKTTFPVVEPEPIPDDFDYEAACKEPISEVEAQDGETQ